MKSVLIFIGASLLSCFGLLYFMANHNSETIFLPKDTAAQWIRYPESLETGPRYDVDQYGLFEKSFYVDEIPFEVAIHIKSLRHFRLWINQIEINHLPDQTHWKKGVCYDIQRFVSQGENTIRVAVKNKRGPSILWFYSKSLPQLRSNMSWSVSLGNGPKKSAIIATDTIPHPITFKGPELISSFYMTYKNLCAAFFLSIFIFIYYHRTHRVKSLGSRLINVRFFFKPSFILIIVLCGWTLLFVHNLPRLPLDYGFDATSHTAYINYILKHNALPLSTSGWQMYQPPFFYLISAMIFKLCSLFLPYPEAIYSVKLIPFLSGVGQILILYLAAKLVFRDQPAIQMMSIVMSALIPMNIYCSHFISNEPLSALLISISLYLTLKILIENRCSNIVFGLLGLSIGLGLLTKMTTILLIPGIFIVLGYALFIENHYPVKQAFFRLFAVLCPIVLISGWFYIKNGLVFGKLFIGNWDPITGFLWWQDPGFHTISYFTKFGNVFQFPYFASFYSFFDGLYATLWGDSLYGGMTRYIDRPPWNYSYMSMGYLLSIPVTVFILIGLACMIRDYLKTLDLYWLVLVGGIFIFLFGIAYMSLKIPSYAQIKAFYGLGMIVPLSLAGGYGIRSMDVFLINKSWQVLRAFMWGGLGVFGACMYLSYWIIG